MTGDDVRLWQSFLCDRVVTTLEVTGTFDDATAGATRDFQAANNLEADGVVGNRTLGVALQQGLHSLPDDVSTDEDGINWPAPPDFDPISSEERAAVFGNFSYTATPAPSNPEAITIGGSWVKDNITWVNVPKHPAFPYAVAFHKKTSVQLLGLFSAWNDAGLLDRILTFGGSWAPRFIRGSRTTLSNHAWGTAFDINVQWNMLGQTPAVKGAKGSVRELVQLANTHGFYWGGHFGKYSANRVDGMHFEISRII